MCHGSLNRGIRDNTNLTMGLILPIGSNWLIDYISYPLTSTTFMLINPEGHQTRALRLFSDLIVNTTTQWLKITSNVSFYSITEKSSICLYFGVKIQMFVKLALLRHAKICWDFLRLAETCWDLLRLAETYCDLLRLTEPCWDFLRLAENCWDLLRFA